MINCYAFLSLRIQVGQYTLSVELLKKMAVLEEKKLGKRPDQMADIYQLLAKSKSEVSYTLSANYINTWVMLSLTVESS